MALIACSLASGALADAEKLRNGGSPGLWGKVEDVIALLKGVQCRNGTSCPDQLARALEAERTIPQAAIAPGE